MPTKAVVMMTAGVFLLAFSVLGLVESVHDSAKVVYSITTIGSILLAVRGWRARRTDT